MTCCVDNEDELAKLHEAAEPFKTLTLEFGPYTN